MWYANDMFHHTFNAEFVTLVSLKVPSGMCVPLYRHPPSTAVAGFLNPTHF